MHREATMERMGAASRTLVMALATLAAGAWVSSQAAPPPNIVLIIADDLGWGDLGVYGHPTIRTPRLDALAAEGTRLTSFYVASPSCSPSRASFLTGRYPIRTGVNGALGPDATIGLPRSEITLAEALKPAGYRTALVGKWHLGTQPGMLPVDQGFDRYFGLLYSNDMIRPWVQTDRPLHLYRDRTPIVQRVDQTTLTDRYTEEAVAFIRASRSQPFLLVLTHSMPHVPLAVADRFRGRSAAGLYGDVIESLDWSTGAILDALRDEGLRDHTIVIFTSDNGPWSEMPPRMFSGDTIKPWDAGTAGPFRGSKASTWEGGMREPFIIRWPGHVPAGRASDAFLTALDLFPTLSKVAGVALPADRPVDGFDVMATLAGTADSPRREFFYLNNGNLEGVRRDRWKLRVVRSAPKVPAVPQLFDLVSDPYERFDVAARQAELVEQLAARMRAFATETGAPTALGPVPPQ
jgi:arylsulfatase A-like enzyme